MIHSWQNEPDYEADSDNGVTSAHVHLNGVSLIVIFKYFLF